jgi:hypothetical protein
MKFEKFFYQNDQRKKLYKVWYEREFSEYFVIFGWLRMELSCYIEYENLCISMLSMHFTIGSR